ncbi:peptidyl-prolyl cis-trans isomerase D [Tranquillimonas rosea]|uniref:Parvulin-like PPIase n=1 Tax=Tranquillimonas rosea TaxID=641238 RepID=A0A1H9P7U7_9RHOB|nr:SurA N-terminal domain-containing protein [Tranquillimonas rosea]SER44394.1 peptidyl-prolyl cis-trans isomerase D [Tranquillimonas rosea]
MVKGAKNPASKLVVWVILVLLIVGLAGFGATNFGGSVDSVGRVGDTEISVDRYSRAMQQRLRSIRQQTGQQLSFSEAQQFGLDRAVLSQVVSQTALEDETDRVGLSVGDSAVRDEILAISAFQGLDGEFDRTAYEQALEQSGLTVAEFEARIRSDTARSLLEGAVVGGLRPVDAFTATLFDYARETRSLTWAALGADDLEEPLPEPSEAQLEEYHAQNEDTFTLPERREITYISLTPEMLIDEVEVPEDELRALYEARIDDYVQPERRLVERLVFDSESAAQEAADAIEAGDTTFDAVVDSRGLSMADVDLGDVARSDLGDAAGEAVFGLDSPGIAGPVQSSLGPALFRMNGILQRQEVSFEEAREELRGELAVETAANRVADRTERIDDLLASGATLDEIADETGMEPGQITWSQGDTDGIAANEGFREAASSAQPGDFPELLELGDDGLFALRVDEILEPSVQPFEEVRDRVADLWRQQTLRDRLVAQAEALLQDSSLEDVEGLDLREATDLTRDGTVEGAPDDMVAAAFEMAEGDVRALPAPDGAVLVRLDTITAPDGDTAEAQATKSAFAERAAQAMSQDALDAFTSAIQNRAGLQLDQQAISAVNAQFQ